jgi:RimJ/RimL family protein N-acetyltransferase
MLGHVLHSDRLLLDPFTSDKVSSEYLHWMNNHDINQFLESRFYSHTLESLENYVADVVRSPNTWMFRILIKSNSKHVGNIKIGPISIFHLRADIGILLGDREYWGQGIAAEAINMISDFAFHELRLHKLTAGCYSKNEGSRKAFESAGFIVEAILREQFCDSDGSWNSGLIMTRYSNLSH